MSIINNNNKTLDNFYDESEQKINIIRSIASELFDTKEDFMIGINGSLARREFTSGSDIDLFLISTSEPNDTMSNHQNQIREKLESEGFKMPSPGGVFENPICKDIMINTIGGDKDTNELITRRMLFLLEGEWVFNESMFQAIRTELIDKYTYDCKVPDKICLFLLNDIIRYWRTICVDYEHKITGVSKPKNIRLIKLRFSRMLLYFSGIVAIDKTKKKALDEKRKTLNDLFSLAPINRIKEAYQLNEHNVFDLYTDFLNAIDDQSVRDILNKDNDCNTNCETIAELHEKARDFKKGLLKLLDISFKNEDSIVKSLLL